MEFIGKNATVHTMAVMDLAQLRKYLIVHEKCLSTTCTSLDYEINRHSRDNPGNN